MLKFTLVENALDSLEHTITMLTSKKNLDTGDYKRVILDLSHIAELLLKEKLRRIHPAFVFADIDKYPSKAAFTVGAEQALKRLKNIGDISFSEQDYAALKTVREKRNEVTHFEFTINEEEAKIVIGNMLVFIFRFSNDELDLPWAERRLNDSSWKKLNEYTSFYEAQLEHVHSQIDGVIPTVECPVCYNDTFDLESEMCLLCGHREDVYHVNAANRPTYTPKLNMKMQDYVTIVNIPMVTPQPISINIKNNNVNMRFSHKFNDDSCN